MKIDNFNFLTRIVWFIFLFYIGIGFAQNKPKVDLSNPNSAIYTHLFFLQDDSYEPEKAAKAIYGLKGEAAVDKAIKLKKILDGNGLKVDFTKVPNKVNYSDTTAYKIGNRYVLFPIRMPEVSVEKYNDKWLYSRETIGAIDELYTETFPWQTEWLQNNIPNGTKKIFGIQIWQYLGLGGLFVFGFLFFYIFKRIIFFVLRKIKSLFSKTSSERINKTLKKLTRPIVLLILIYIFKKVLPALMLGLDTNTFLILALNIAETVFWIYVFLKLVQLIMHIYAEYTQRTHIKLDDQLVPILSNFLTGIVFFLGALKLFTLFGIPASSVIAGASIGGLALALASQDTVKNLIGTFMIFLDKPFHIGDWIEAGEVVGTVEEVGFRSSRIRAADTSIYQIPNSTLSEIVINNKGMRLFRRYQTELGIRYDTPPELIETFVNGLKKIIASHPSTRKDAFDVVFNGFGDSALLIMINTYFHVDDWSLENQSKHSLHMAIVKLAKTLGVEFAFPSSTLMIEQFPDKKSFQLDYNLDTKKAEQEIQQIIDDLKQQNIKTDSGNSFGDDD
jgi:MscS family membrane protein